MSSVPPPPFLPLFPTVRPPSNHHHHHRNHLLLPILAASLALPLLLLFLSLLSIFLYRRFYLSRTAPTADPKSPLHLAAGPPLRRFSYSVLRRATASFSTSTRLGHGAFGTVHKAILPGHPPLAVKAMDAAAASVQGHQEFNTELSLAAVTLGSPQILSLLGYSSNRRGSRRLLVYELMPNRSLQECLLETKALPLSNWSIRFTIALDVAQGLEYLHHSCNPPVIHGDIKPSNVLLDGDFRAKIGDFGLARLKTEEEDSSILIDVEAGDNGSILEETESVATGVGEEGTEIEQSPESCCIRVAESDGLSPEVGGEDRMSVESGGERKAANSRRDWWWRQGNPNGGGGAESVKVKDYVMEWIGTQIKKERPWIESTPKIDTKKEKKNKKKWKWWASLDDDDDQHSSSSKKRKPREWWKEEFCDELSKKKKKKVKTLNSNSKEETLSVSAVTDDGGGGRMSGGVSSTPSMRGTICYIAPEYGSFSRLSEKCDVYSFGVLLLVLISGRRPLQVTSSPMSQFERANLISWARQLASSNGRLLDLVDVSLSSLGKEDKEQALLCITVALLCLQRSPEKRPTMKDVVGMLSGEGGVTPQLPFEFSPSPPSNFQFKSRRRKAA